MKFAARPYHMGVRHTALLVTAALALTVATGSADDLLRSFDQDPVGAAPPGFTLAAARLTAPGRWLVRADGAGRYLAHLSEPTGGEGFALALVDVAPPRELRLSARIKLADGARVGGLVWGYQDADNFYAVALDLNQQAVSLYRVSGGNRIRLELEDDLELDRDAWHVLRVEYADARIRVALGGIGIMRARSREANRIAGQAGVWSAGNATTWFDDLNVQEARERNR